MTLPFKFHQTKPPNPDILVFFQTLWKREHVPEGYLVIHEKAKSRSHFFKANDLEAAAHTAEVLKDRDNILVAMGLQRGKLSHPQRGAEKGVVAIPGFWFEFDLWNPMRDSKCPRETFPQTREEIIQFLDDSLPKPTVLLDTGGGFHGFWVFKNPLIISSDKDRKEAKALSTAWHNRLANLGIQFNWHFDNVSSLEHLMRIPGTINHKYGTIVTIEQIGETFQEDDLMIFTAGNASGAHKQAANGTDGNTLNPELVKLVNRCTFLKHCEEDAATLSETEWHRMVCILASTGGGPELIHHLSKPYHKYNSDETDKKIQNAIIKNPGPITCEHLKSIWNCGQDCKVTSPIHLLKPTPNPFQPIAVPNQEDEDPEDANVEFEILKDKIPDTPFPWEVFPEQVQACLGDLADALSVSQDMTGVIALVVISSAIGSAVSYVESKKGYTAPINLWLAIIGETGHKKTPTLDILLRPVYEYQKKQNDEAKKQSDQNQGISGSQENENKAQFILNQLFNSANQAQNTKTKTPQPQSQTKPESTYTTDPTIEALLQLLCENAKGILLYQDELSSFLLNFNKYRGGRGG
ncbi:MAG: hypothetical protein QG577_1224, partial [Thermodesulfobacteriota bacterium]|nr:hypothetical protein [Thermodesulfobacteriota bacterium]